MRRRLLAYLCLIIALVLASLAVLVFRPADQINPQNIAKIKPGMAERDVEEILGGRGQFLLSFARAWDGADWTATVCFDHNGLVLTTMLAPQETFLAKSSPLAWPGTKIAGA